jgi:hypothetical protein
LSDNRPNWNNILVNVLLQWQQNAILNVCKMKLQLHRVSLGIYFKFDWTFELGMHRIVILPNIRPAGYPANLKAGYPLRTDTGSEFKWLAKY